MTKIKIIKEQEEKQSKPLTKWVVVGLIALLTIIATTLLFPPKSKTTDIKPSSSKVEKSTSSTKTISKDTIEAIESVISSEAKATNKPFDLEVESIGGGYVFSETIYYKGDNNREQKVTAITPPENPQEQSTAPDALLIRDQLLKSVNGNIVTINGKETHLLPGEILFEVYETEDEDTPYIVVMFLNNIAFGYVKVNKDLSLKPVFVSNIADFEDHSQGNAPVEPPADWQS